MYAPTSTAPEEEIEQLYEGVLTALRSENTYFKIITGYFNAKLGETREVSIKQLGRFGTGICNTRGDSNKLLAKRKPILHELLLPKTRKKKMDMKKTKFKNEIDFILSNKKYIVKDVAILNQFDTDSDHRLVRIEVQINNRAERNKLTRKIRFPTLNELKQNETEYRKELDKKLTRDLGNMSIDTNRLLITT